MATILALVAATACSGGHDDAGENMPAHVDSIEPPSAPAQPGSALKILKGSGAVLARPVLRLATFNNDPAAAGFDTFAVKLAASGYWAATTEEYGVGSLTAGPSQAFTFAWPTNTTDGDLMAGQPSDIEAFLARQLDNASPAWGLPDPSSIYVLLLPRGINVWPNGGSGPSACDANVLAWHTAMTLPANNVTIPYVVVPNCGPRGALSEFDSRTLALSHALVEAATNPLLNAYGSVDANHVVWQVAAGSPEVAAACVAALGGTRALWTTPADLPFVVQRTWSNAAASAGRPPCVPSAAGEVAIATVPVVSTLFKAVVSASATAPKVNAVGVQIGVGNSSVVPLRFISGTPTPAPWVITVSEVGSQVLALSLDRPSGSQGDTAQLTIKVVGTPQASAQELVRITSTLGTQISHDYLLVHN